MNAVAAPYEVRRGAHLVSTDPGRLDFDVIHGFLSRSYWSAGVPRETLRRAIAGSLCFGLYEDGRQIGFARAVTDRATYAYLADVFVIESHRGRGLGVWLIESLLAHPDLQGLRRFALATRDAHSLYARFGFKPQRAPQNHLERHAPDVYAQPAAAPSAARPA